MKEPLQGTLFPGFEVKAKQEPPRDVKKQSIKALKQKVAELQAENQSLKKENQSLKEKADAFDELAKSNSLFTTTVIAKSVGKSAIWLNKYLQNKRVQFMQGDVWVLYARYQNKGYTQICWYNYNEDANGRPLEKPHTYWTGAGLLFIRSLLKEDGLI